MTNSIGDYQQLSIADFHFHICIAKASKNRVFLKVMDRMKDLVYRHLEQMNKDLELDPVTAVERHRQIYLAIKNRDSEQARMLLGQNIDISIDALCRRSSISSENEAVHAMPHQSREGNLLRF
jgi:DNA-binding FadR family transcriptional regulator